MKTYKDKVSGETLYVDLDQGITKYHKDKAMRILHRRDGPAIEWPGGFKSWYANDKRHRVDGPAYEGIGRKVWYVDGVLITFITSNGEYEGPESLQDLQDDL